MDLKAFIAELAGARLQPYQKPLMEALLEDKTVRALTWNEQRQIQRQAWREYVISQIAQ